MGRSVVVIALGVQSSYPCSNLGVVVSHKINVTTMRGTIMARKKVAATAVTSLVVTPVNHTGSNRGYYRVATYVTDVVVTQVNPSGSNHSY